MKKKIMIIGPRQAGKSTLANLLERTARPLKKTQDAVFGKKTIDVPAAYLENTMMYKYIIALSQMAGHVLMLADQSNPTEVYSPGFARIFTCPVTGVITKSDLHPENYEKCVVQLKRAGLEGPFFCMAEQDEEKLKLLETRLEQVAAS